MTMSHKIYQQVAYTLRDVWQEYSAYDSPDPLFRLAMKATAGRLASMFELDNPDFNRDKFMEACGMQIQP